jgi:hypothetical protein
MPTFYTKAVVFQKKKAAVRVLPYHFLIEHGEYYWGLDNTFTPKRILKTERVSLNRAEQITEKEYYLRIQEVHQKRLKYETKINTKYKSNSN